MRISDIYDLKFSLGKGFHSESFMAIHKFSAETLAIKKIECKDERHANLAFEEYSKLKEFHHELFSDIHKIFIHWDKDVSSMFLYIVKEYMKMPNITSYIQLYQNKKAIPTQFIERLFSSAVDVLNTFQSNNLIHGAIHPNNIFTNEIKVRINDAICKSILQDIRTCKANNSADVYKWSPPEAQVCGEVLDKSDSWALGCVLVQTMYAGLSSAEMTEHLMIFVRKNGFIPEVIQQQLKEHYSSILVDLVSSMIVLDIEERIGISALYKSEFMNKLLDETDSKRKIRKARLRRPVSECNLPYDGGIQAILSYLTDNLEHENCAAAAMAWIAETQCRDSADVPDLLPLNIWRVLNIHNDNASIVENALAIFTHCTCVGKMFMHDCRSTDSMGPNETIFLETLIDNSTFWNENTLKMIYNVLVQHSDEIRVQRNGFVLLEIILCPSGHITFEQTVENAYWLKNSKLYQKICSMGFAKLILDSLNRVHMGCADLLRPALAIVWELCIDRVNAKLFLSMGAFPVVRNTMLFYPHHIGILNQGAICITALATESALEEESLIEMKISYLLLNTADNHHLYPDLAYNILLAISTILRRSETLALDVVKYGGKLPQSRTISIINKLYKTHINNVKIIESTVKVLDAILSYDGIVEAVINDLTLIKSILTEILNRFPTAKGLGDASNRALERIPDMYWEKVGTISTAEL